MMLVTQFEWTLIKIGLIPNWGSNFASASASYSQTQTQMQSYSLNVNGPLLIGKVNASTTLQLEWSVTVAYQRCEVCSQSFAITYLVIMIVANNQANL